MLSVITPPKETIATASISGTSLTITPVGAGTTSVTVKESNGNQTVTINITVLATSITPQNIQLYDGGTAKTVTIQGLNMGTLTIENGPDTSKATASINGTSLTISPVAAGSTSLTLKESNGNKTATISISVLETSIEANPTSVTANIGDGPQTVTLSGTNAGAFSVVTGPDGAVATAQISGNTLTITPVGGGETSVVVKEANGNKQLTINITISAGVTASDIPATDYGAIVNGYDCTNNAAVNNWKLFYADDTNIYLIADDYIPYTYIPSSINSTPSKPNKGTLAKSAYFDNILFDYNQGLSNITNQSVKELNNDYYMRYSYNSTQYNSMRSIAYMLDINAWSVYAGEYAEYAIGGPSIELLFKSYNEKYTTDYKAQANYQAGYQIRKDSSSSWQYYINAMLTKDNLYVISSVNDALGMWISSPSANSGSELMYVDFNGRVGNVSYNETTYGFRPVVCLKSDVKLQKNSDGSYTIVGEGSEETPGGDTEGEISSADVPATDYGAIVKGYDCDNSAAVNNWLLFYADDNNIYLIADDYIPYEYIPSNSSGNKPNRKLDSERGIYFSEELLNNYGGSEDIKDEKIKALNNDYFTKGYTSYYDSMKAVAYMLDTNTWSVYAGDKADYAIGGPTIELFFKSYDEKYGAEYMARARSNLGYEMSEDGGITWWGPYDNYLNQNDSTYVISSEEKANGLVIASPYYENVERNRLIGIGNEGRLYSWEADDYNSIGTKYGLRPIVCLKSDVKLQKNSDGSYTIVDEETPGGETGGIASADVPATDYGAIVKGYDCDNNAAVNSWKLFYADDSNAYLIADDYISYNYVPSNAYGNKPTKGSNNYTADFSGILDDYIGSPSITDSRIKALNNDYFNVKRYTSTYYNMISVAYMLDINAWSVYAGENADYAIGGPTVEMFFNSYNEKYGTNYVAKATSTYGYSVGNGSASSDSISLSNTSDTLYVISSKNNAQGMWLASPSAAYRDEAVLGVANNGNVDYYDYSNAYFTGMAFRPVVCLNSDVQFKKNSDGSFTIVGSGGGSGGETTPPQ